MAPKSVPGVQQAGQKRKSLAATDHNPGKSDGPAAKRQKGNDTGKHGQAAANVKPPLGTQAPNGHLQDRKSSKTSKDGTHKDARQDSGKKTSAHGNRRRATQHDARKILTQTTTKSFKDGALDVDKFVKAREFEIKALQDAMVRSKRALTTRAFQMVPRELRRRAGAWNANKIPGRLRKRAARDIREDGTKTGKARDRGAGRKLDREARIRREAIKVKRKEGAQRQAEKDKAAATRAKKGDQEAQITNGQTEASASEMAPKARLKVDDVLSQPPKPKSQFRQRQLRKTWLPTHIFHAKRAHISAPSEPLWGFAMPLSPTAKSYRPTHRATTESGAIVWDVSYVSTIGLQGTEVSLLNLLRGLGASELQLTGRKGMTWRVGARAWQGWLRCRDVHPPQLIAPVTLIWQAADSPADSDPVEKRAKRELLLRVHPSAFMQLWEQVMRLCKVQKPEVKAEDLRYQLGAIEIVGPGAMETLQAALWPAQEVEQAEADSLEGGSRSWKSLNGLDSPTALPNGTSLAFSISDPRLHHPPRTTRPPADTGALVQSLLTLGQTAPAPQSVLDSSLRQGGTSAMASQKAINRRKTDSVPGSYPAPLPTDPHIPVLLYTSLYPSSSSITTTGRSKAAGPASWTLVLPWSAVPAVWQSINYYPLSTGGQVRLGCLDQQRQLAMEQRVAWWPGDFPGTDTGDKWVAREAELRRKEWGRKPPSRRANFEGLDLGNGERKGEVGEGWATDFALVVGQIADAAAAAAPASSSDAMDVDTSAPPGEGKAAAAADTTTPTTADIAKQQLPPPPPPPSPRIWHCPSATAAALLAIPTAGLAPPPPGEYSHALTTVRITFLGRGHPTPGARVYRLPARGPLRTQWLALLPHPSKPPKAPRARVSAPTTTATGRDPLLPPGPSLQPGAALEREQPPCPGRGQLLGFVTSGGFNLREGKGTAVASLGLGRVLAALQLDNGGGEQKGVLGRGSGAGRRLCIVRNAGEVVGRLAAWEVV